MNRKIWITLVVLALAVPAGMVAAQSDGDGWGRQGRQGKGGGQRGARGSGDMRMLDRLDLSDRQKEQIKEIRKGNKSQHLELRKEINRLQNRLHGEMLEDQPNKRQVLALAEQIGEARSKMHVMRIGQQLDIRALLTDEQRDELIAMPRHGRGGPHGRHGNMRRGGGEGLHRMMMERHEGERQRSQ